MRTLMLLSALLLAAGCATRPVAPHEYLDEETAATITAVADPWTFI